MSLLMRPRLRCYLVWDVRHISITKYHSKLLKAVWISNMKVGKNPGQTPTVGRGTPCDCAREGRR